MSIRSGYWNLVHISLYNNHIWYAFFQMADGLICVCQIQTYQSTCAKDFPVLHLTIICIIVHISYSVLCSLLYCANVTPYLSRLFSSVSTKGATHMMPASLTRRSIGPISSTAFLVAAQSDKSTHTVCILGF